MATVVYKDNIIIIGGQDEQDVSRYRPGDPLNDVLMYNIHSLECKRLPSMLQGRSGHAAVIMGDVIVVMGGHITVEYARHDEIEDVDTVEYYVMGDNKWKKLPAMNRGRNNATACVYVWTLITVITESYWIVNYNEIELFTEDSLRTNKRLSIKYKL